MSVSVTCFWVCFAFFGSDKQIQPRHTQRSLNIDHEASTVRQDVVNVESETAHSFICASMTMSANTSLYREINPRRIRRLGGEQVRKHHFGGKVFVLWHLCTCTGFSTPLGTEVSFLCAYSYWSSLNKLVVLSVLHVVFLPCLTLVWPMQRSVHPL